MGTGMRGYHFIRRDIDVKVRVMSFVCFSKFVKWRVIDGILENVMRSFKILKRGER